MVTAPAMPVAAEQAENAMNLKSKDEIERFMMWKSW
jgi:hypothetical protein